MLFVGTLAQLVEQRTFNPFVVGSTPAGPTSLALTGYEKPAIELVAGFFVSCEVGNEVGTSKKVGKVRTALRGVPALGAKKKPSGLGWVVSHPRWPAREVSAGALIRHGFNVCWQR